jgi:hypothetical protein
MSAAKPPKSMLESKKKGSSSASSKGSKDGDADPSSAAGGKSRRARKKMRDAHHQPKDVAAAATNKTTLKKIAEIEAKLAKEAAKAAATERREKKAKAKADALAAGVSVREANAAAALAVAVPVVEEPHGDLSMVIGAQRFIRSLTHEWLMQLTMILSPPLQPPESLCMQTAENGPLLRSWILPQLGLEVVVTPPTPSLSLLPSLSTLSSTPMSSFAITTLTIPLSSTSSAAATTQTVSSRVHMALTLLRRYRRRSNRRISSSKQLVWRIHARDRLNRMARSIAPL